MNINKNRNSSKNDISYFSYESKQTKQENNFYNIFSYLKNNKKFDKKKNLKSILTNYKNFNKKSKKTNIKKNLESSINLSKNYYCGSFLAPDYAYISGAAILHELKSKGPEKTIIRHFSKDYSKPNFIKNSKSNSATRNQENNIKSKYFNLVHSNISNINRVTSLKKNKAIKCNNRMKYYDKYNKSFNNFFNGKNLKIKNIKNNYFNYNFRNDRFFEKKGIITNNKSLNSLYSSTINISRTYLNSSTSCSSKTIKFIKKN